MAEDLRLRPLTNQWLAPSHPVPPSSWLTQNHPFALHPGIPTTGTTFDPSHHPLASAFKLAQDSLTGQLLFIPNSGMVFLSFSIPLFLGSDTYL